MADFIRKINELPIAASQAAPSSTLATNLGKKIDTVTPSGSGAVVTSVTKSGNTGLSVTKKDLIPDWGYVEDYSDSDGTAYHVYWQIQPTSSNQTFGVGFSNGKLYRFYNNNGTYTIQAYDKDTTTNTVPSAYCTTGAGTAAKTATCTDYALKTPSYIHVLIKNANTVQGAITLNINGKGAKPIYIDGNPSSSSNYTLPAGTYIAFYTGSRYEFRTDERLPADISGNAYSADNYKTRTGDYNIEDALNSKLDSVSTTGSGSVVTNVQKDGSTVKVTKGDISLKKLTNPNFDNITETGIYDVQITQACTGAPQGTDNTCDSLILIVSNIYGEGITSQTAHMANGRTLSRRRWSDNTWDEFWANRESRGLAGATDAHAEGDSTVANGNNSHAEGYNTRASGSSSHAEGNGSKASGGQAHAEGYNTEASGSASHAEGANTKATHSQTHAEGYGGHAYSESSHVEGSLCTTGGVSAHAEGGATVAAGKDSHAEGYSDGVIEAVLASDTNAGSGTFVTTTEVTTGNKNWLCVPSIGFVSRIVASSASRSFTVIGSCPRLVEAGTTIFFVGHGALGQASHVEGYQTLASADYSHAEGFQSRATGYIAHSEGYNTEASGDYSHTEGLDSIASATYSHAEGYSTKATASYSHAEGCQTTASGNYSHSEGIGTAAQSNGMHAAGMYNATKSGYARVTGWGTYETAKDIERLDTSGNLWILGTASFNGGTSRGQLTVNVGDANGVTISHGTANKDACLLTKRTDTNISCEFGVGSGGKKHGVWSSAKSNWMIYTDENGNTTMNGTATKATNADITRTSNVTSGDKLQIGSGSSVNVVNALRSRRILDQGNKDQYLNVYWSGSGSVTGSNDIRYIAGFYAGQDGATATICDIPAAKFAAYVSKHLTEVLPSGNTFTVQNSDKTGPGVLAAGAIQLVLNASNGITCQITKSASFTVSKSDISNADKGMIYLYRNTASTAITATWTYTASGGTTSGPIQPGCSAMFMLWHASGYFSRIS